MLCESTGLDHEYKQGDNLNGNSLIIQKIDIQHKDFYCSENVSTDEIRKGKRPIKIHFLC